MKKKSPRKNATLEDVAGRAGVSIASVSRVLNNIPPISDELRSQVETAVEQLGYRPRRSATATRAPVVVIIGDLHNTYYAEIVSGIQNVADRFGILVNVLVHNPESQFSARFFRWISRSQSSGLIICSSNAYFDAELQRLRKIERLPVVCINPPERIAGIPSVRIDYARAIEKAVHHALRFGHRRIGLFTSGDTAYSSIAKQAGVEAALEKAGHPLNRKYYVVQPATVEGGFQAMNTILALPADERPTAIIASNDLMALGAMHAIRTAGLSIPGDITVVGFDDIAMAAHANPPLSTGAPPKYEMGVRAMELILESQQKELGAQDSYVVLESPLIVRESSGPCSAH